MAHIHTYIHTEQLPVTLAAHARRGLIVVSNQHQHLSPVLFLLIMDPLLKSLQNKGLGPSVGDLYAGGFIHADDIRTISSSWATLQEQINTVCTFAANNGLTLNPTKCEVILISPSKPATTAPIATLEGEGLTPQLSAKCLGYWWCWDLSAIKKGKASIFRLWSHRSVPGSSKSNLRKKYLRNLCHPCATVRL